MFHQTQTYKHWSGKNDKAMQAQTNLWGTNHTLKCTQEEAATCAKVVPQANQSCWNQETVVRFNMTHSVITANLTWRLRDSWFLILLDAESPLYYCDVSQCRQASCILSWVLNSYTSVMIDSFVKQNSVAGWTHATLVTHSFCIRGFGFNIDLFFFPSWRQCGDHPRAPVYLSTAHEHNLHPSCQHHTGPSGQQHHGSLQLHWDQHDYSSG